MNIYLVRHGQTHENAKKTYYGSIDVGLNEKGISQIEEAAKFFREVSLDKVYISNTKRAYETAEIILKNRNVHIFTDDRLNETNFGDFEGKNFEEIASEYPEKYREWIEDWKNFRPPNGETFMEMYKRVLNFMNELKETEDEDVLIVTHSGVIKAILCYVMDENVDLFWKFACANGDRVLIKWEYGNLFLDSITHV